MAERGLASAEQLKQLLDTQRKAFIQSQASLAGTAVLVDLFRRELIVKELPQENEIKRIPLSPAAGPQNFNPNDWERWGSHLVIVNPEDGIRQAEFEWQTGALYGLVFNRDRTYLYNEGRTRADYLALARHAIFGGIYKGAPQAAPYDLLLSPGQRWLCISDRGAGNISILDTWNFELKGSVSVREPGRTQSLNLAIDENKELIYITDNSTPNLQVLNLRTLELRRERVNQGQLGNLVLTPDGKYLYVVTLNPNEGLIHLNTDTWVAEKAIKLKGQLFKTECSDPCDLLSLSADGKTLLIMTYLDEPQPFTPVISVIDAEQVKTLRRYALKDGIKPFQLAFGLPNPVKPHTRRLEELVLEAGLIDTHSLEQLKQELLKVDAEAAPVTAAVTVAVAEPAVEKPKEAPPMVVDLVEPEDRDKVLNDSPTKTNRIELPPEAVEEIVEILVSTFQKQVDEDITGYKDVMDRLREEAEKARQDLEEYDSTIVQIDSLFEGRHLQTAVLREAILMMLDLKETVKFTTLKTCPSNCPNCKQALLGSWDCEACGFEVESPERSTKRRIASADAIANLPMGHL
ncbi:MAG TPA: Hsp70 family protein, partial [Candidatus Obscuribacterales bacterium]